MWLVVASVLSVFNISKARDENGVEIDIDPDAFSTGLSRHVTFHVSIDMDVNRGLEAPLNRLNARLFLDRLKLRDSSVRVLPPRRKMQAQHEQLVMDGVHPFKFISRADCIITCIVVFRGVGCELCSQNHCRGDN